MKLRHLLVAAAALVALWTAPLQAAQVFMCQGDVSGASTGARTIGGTNSAVPSQTLYSLNSAGCALIQLADIGYFQSQGYTQNSSEQSIVFQTGVQTGTTDLVVGALPAGAYLKSVLVNNLTANAVTGNISVGSTANGTDIVASLVCAANCVASAPGTTALAKSVFTATGGAATTIHAAAITSWNSANVNITVVYGYF